MARYFMNQWLKLSALVAWSLLTCTSVAAEVEEKIEYTPIWKTVTVFTVLLLLVLLWIWQTRQQNKVLQNTRQALKKSEHLYRHLFKNTGVGIVYTDPAHRFLQANDAFCQFIGYEEDELRQMTPLDITHPDDIAESKTLLEKETDGELDSFTLEKRYLHKDGSTRWGYVNSSMFRDKNGSIIASTALITDITERKRVEEALLGSEAMWRSLTENSPDHILTLDRNQNILFLNYASPGLTKEQLLGTPLYKYVEEGQQAEIKHLLEQTIQTGKPCTYETRFEAPEGQTIYYESIVAPRILSGEIVGLTVNARNITERKLAEEALRESEHYNRMLFEKSTIGLALCRMNGDLVDINPAYASILGRSIEETLKLSYWDITPEKYAAYEQAQLKQLEQTGSYGPYEKEYIHANGHFVPVRLSGQILERGGKKFIWSSVEDITEYKCAEVALKQSEERFRMLVEGCPVGIGISTKGKVQYVNPAYLHMFGYDKETDLADSSLIDNVAPECRQEITDRIARRFNGEDVPNRYETTGLRQDGSRIPFEVEVHLMDLPDGKASVAFTTDLTERKHAEKALQRSEVLERLAIGASLNDILTALVINAEKHNPEKRCSVLLLDKDGKRLRHGAAPSLPDFYTEAIDDIEMGPDIISCGAAAFTGKRVIVEDIMSHPDWADYRELAEKACLRACWSEPIISSTGNILGAFAIYDREPRSTTQSDLDFIRDSARLAAIAIEHKQAESELRKHSRAVEQSPASIIVTDTEGSIEYVNPKFTELTGYSSTEAVGQTPRILKSGKHSAEFYTELWETITSGKEWRGEFLDRKKNGETFWEYASISPIFNKKGEITNFLAVKEDINERKESEDALRESEMTLSAIFEQAAVGVAMIESRSGKFLRINQKYCDITGYPLKEILSLDFLEITYPDDLQEDLDNMQLLLDGKIREYAMEMRYLRKDGSVVWVNLTVSPMWKQGEQADYHIAVVEDITERRQIEERTLELLEQNRQLNQRMFQLQEKERRNLARELHDELGQWLTAARLNTENIIRKTSESEHSDIYANALIIGECVTEMYKNTRGMIRQLRPTFLDELGLVESIKCLTDQWQAQHSAIDIILTIDGELDGLNENLNITLYRIIQESLTNAAKYARAHTVAVQLIRQPAEAGRQDSLLLTVEDDGKGMDRKAFTEGFGLTGMRERALAMGGNFNTKSTPGKGLRIEIRLPVNQNGLN